MSIFKVVFNQYSIELNEDFYYCDSRVLFKLLEILVFFVRDVVYVILFNFESCVYCIRVFVEVSVNGGMQFVIR